MKILKGVCVYTLIILAMLLIVGILLFAAMFLMPDFGLFGYRVINKSKNPVETVEIKLDNLAEIDATKPINLVVEAQGHNVSIEYVSDSTTWVIIDKTDDMFGLYKYNKNYSEKASYSINKENNQIKITADGLEGAVSYRNSFLRVRIPKQRTMGENNTQALRYNINAKSTSGNISLIGGSKEENVKDLKIENLSVTTKSGNFGVSGLRTSNEVNKDDETKFTPVLLLNSLSLKTNKGNFDFSKLAEKIVVTNANVNVDSYAEQSPTYNDIYNQLGSANINSNSGTIEFANAGELTANINITGEDIVFKAGKVSTLGNGFYFDSAYGVFDVKSINNKPNDKSAEKRNINIISNNIDVKLEEINGEASIKTEYGNISIKILNDQTRLESVHGDITVDNANNVISATNQYGNILIKNFKSKCYVLNKQGSINVSYDKDYDATLALDQTRIKALTENFVQLINTNGSIVANNLVNKTNITALGSSNVTVNFKKLYVFDNNEVIHSIVVNGSTANVNVPSTENFWINNISKGGKIGGKVGTTTIENKEGKQWVVSPISEPAEGENNKNTIIETKANGGRINFSTKNA